MGGLGFSTYMMFAILLYLTPTILSLSIPSSHWMHPRGNYKFHLKHRCLHSLAHVFGLGSCVVGPKKSEADGITEELLQKFELMAQYSAAAYCPGNNNGTGILITCPSGNCPLVEAAKAHGAFEFENTLWSDDTGFVAIDDANQLIVLAFRGTESLTNWRVNLDGIRRHTDLCKHCHVHSGFWDAWTEIRDRVKTRVLEAVKNHPYHRLVITGHSLGGAIAILAAGDFRKINHDLAARTELYTFGSPRVGNGHTAAFLTYQSDLSFRITSMSDPIPRQPTYLLGYRHTSPEFWIHSHPKYPGPNDIKVVTGLYNKHGNSGKHGFKMARHREYLGPITACRTEADNSG
ncbi:hypothetical protein MMC07_006430 [Pseudocyphellaria aurata]|nr:hypothetical protein [Pseudocyphellaria aurata]